MLRRRPCVRALLSLPLLAVARAAHAKAEADWHLLGQARMRWFGLTIYDVRLWAPEPPGRDWWARPLALELEYARSLRGRDIAERSLQEMRRQQPITSADASRWLARMQALFPDVRAGDRLSGRLRPGEGAEFFFNDAPLATLDEPLFARLFFGIWLSEQTSEPALRAQLLGLRS